jgi:hypothetical protein
MPMRSTHRRTFSRQEDEVEKSAQTNAQLMHAAQEKDACAAASDPTAAGDEQR